MTASLRLGCALAACLFAARTVPAQTVDPSGHWEGALKIKDAQMPLSIELARNSLGAIGGTVSIPNQDVKDIGLWNFAIDGQAITFQIILSAAGDNAFSGTIAADGQSMAGTLVHDSYSIPFELSRTGASRIEPPIVGTAVTKAVEGSWNGSVDRNGKVSRVAMTIANRPEGTATGRLVSLDRGNAEFVLSAIAQQDAAVTFEVGSVGGSFRGTISADHSELVGMWKENGLSFPLTFKRAQ
ncbi:MAG TPA: hypothetical protein VH583_20565 [Vicinamibacterales bacterium]|jgi:hypothetical protein